MPGATQPRRDSARYPDSLPRDRRRALGAYYTPSAIVDHLADLAVRLSRPPRARRPLRVLDPAVGDGAFLAALARRMPASLNGVDIDPGALALAKESLGDGARLVRADYLSEIPPLGGPFDLIIGNPPWGGWNRRLGAAARKTLRERFATARGLLDPFAPFIERSTSLLCEGGILALVLPDYFLLKNYPAARRHVLEHYRLEELARWGQVFPDVSLDACTLVAVRRTAPARHRVRCLPAGPAGPVAWIPQSRFAARPGQAFNLALDDARIRLLTRLERRGIRLGDWLESHEGIHSGNSRSRLFLPAGVDGGSAVGCRPEPLIFGRDEIRPFTLRWAGRRVVYDRAFIRRDRGEYANLGRREWFASPKLMIRRTGDRVVAALDSEGFFASNNLFVGRARPGCPVPLEYLEGYLNSALATWCFRTLQPRAGRIFAELKLVHLNELPVPAPRGPRDVSRIASLVRRLRRAGPGRAGAHAADLDAAFMRLAGLEPDESKRVLCEIRSTRPPSFL